MNQGIQENHLLDDNGKPAGGMTIGKGIHIEWQNGPLAALDPDAGPIEKMVRKEPNGAFVEGVLQAALGRIQFYQSTEFACRENQFALQHIEEALNWLQHRTSAREARGVEGTHEK